MSGLGGKTAVSYLQEYLVSQKMIPQYELIGKNESQGVHKPEFTIRVQKENPYIVEGITSEENLIRLLRDLTIDSIKNIYLYMTQALKAGDLSEEGVGKTKQEAKHRAAEKMLKTLKVISDSGELEEPNELDQEIVENYVGLLKELCYNQHYPEPKYTVGEEAGPPHLKIFKMVCSVSHLQQYGVDRTKKRAKQWAAAKMIQCLKEVGGKKVEDALANPESPSKSILKIMSEDEDREVIEKYQTLKSTGAPYDTKDYAAFYKDHYKAYIGLQESSPTLKRVMNDSQIITLENSLSLIEEIAKELGVKVSMEKIPCKKDDEEFTVINMSITPPIGEMGSSESNAAFNLLHTFLCLCSE